MCFPSIASMQLRKFHFSLNSSAILRQLSSVNFRNTFSFNVSHITLQVSDIIFDTVLCTTGNAYDTTFLKLSIVKPISD